MTTKTDQPHEETGIEHSPLPWSVAGIRPITLADGVVTVDLDAPYAHWSIRRVYKDGEDRRCTQFIADVHVTAGRESEAEPTAAYIVEAANAYPTLTAQRDALLTACEAITDPTTDLSVAFAMVKAALASVTGQGAS